MEDSFASYCHRRWRLASDCRPPPMHLRSVGHPMVFWWSCQELLVVMHCFLVGRSSGESLGWYAGDDGSVGIYHLLLEDVTVRISTYRNRCRRKPKNRHTCGGNNILMLLFFGGVIFESLMDTMVNLEQWWCLIYLHTRDRHSVVSRS